MKTSYRKRIWQLEMPSMDIYNSDDHVWVTNKNGTVSAALIQDVETGQPWMLQIRPDPYVQGKQYYYSSFLEGRYHEMMLDCKVLKKKVDIYHSANARILELLNKPQQFSSCNSEECIQLRIHEIVASALKDADAQRPSINLGQ